MEAEFGPSMLYVTNQDKPGFVGQFASLLGDAGINIATFHLGRQSQGGDAIALVEVDGVVPAELLDKVERCRMCSRRSRCGSRYSSGFGQKWPIRPAETMRRSDPCLTGPHPLSRAGGSAFGRARRGACLRGAGPRG